MTWGREAETIVKKEGFYCHRAGREIDLTVRMEKSFWGGRYFVVRDKGKVVLGIKLPKDYTLFNKYAHLLEAVKNGFVEFDEEGKLERLIMVPTRRNTAKQKQYSPKQYYWQEPRQA